jgi:hypothetical protein
MPMSLPPGEPDEFATWPHLSLAIFGAIALSGLAIFCGL